MLPITTCKIYKNKMMNLIKKFNNMRFLFKKSKRQQRN